MATDATGRRVVSITVADSLEAKRVNLVLERRAMNLNYGDLFIAHMLVKNGANMDDIAAELKKLAAQTDFAWVALASQRLGQVEYGMRRNLLRSLSLDAFATALER